MGEKQPETPLPRGTDTALLGFLTSVGASPPPSVERLFMRLRIFWFFFMAIPILIGAYLIGALVAGFASLVLGEPAAAGTTSVAVGIVGFVVGLVLFVRLFALWFNRLTRGYRARLEARATEQTTSLANAPTPGGRVLDHVSLGELDARLAPRDLSSEDPPR